jgi:diguanylate cyclase (GGDEF)-like protein
VDDHVPGLLDHSAAHAEHLSVAIVDLDHFKLVNDSFSHETGDGVLVALAELLGDSLPDGAFAARLGGEEFVVVLPGLDATEAALVCEDLRARIQDHPWETIRPGLTVTASFGVASTFAGSTGLSHLLGQADQRLYAAKRKGRNRVVAR